MVQPTVSTAQFVTPDPNAMGGPWALQVFAQGTGFVARGYPLTATVGSVVVQAIFLFPEGDGFMGFLATMPSAGDVLSVGYENIVSTGIQYQAGVA